MAQSSRQVYWSGVLADFGQSGLTHVQFCQLRQISVHSFRDWLYRLRPGMRPRKPRTGHISPPPSTQQIHLPAFLPVHVRRRPLVPTIDHHVSQPPTPLELVLSDQCQVRVPTGFDPATLHQLLDVLEQRS